MPITTATIRSTETVTTAVTTNAIASARVERRIERTVATCTMRTAVTMSTPDERGERDRADRPRCDEHDQQQHERVDDRGDPGLRPPDAR